MEKLKSYAPWIVSFVVGLLGIGSLAAALTGNFPIGIENCSGCSFTVPGAPAQEGTLGATGTRFPNGLSADATSPNPGQVRGTTLTVTSDSRLNSLVQTGSATTFNATSTVTSAQVCDSRVWTLASSPGNNPTLTLPIATSSLLADCLSTDGDKLGPISIYNISTSTYTIAAGVGGNLRWSRASTTLLSGVQAELFIFRTSSVGYGASLTVYGD